MAHPAYVLPAPVPPRPWGGSHLVIPRRSGSGRLSRRRTMAMMRKSTSSPASNCLGGPFASTSQTTPRVRRDQTASPISGERLTAALRPPLRIPVSCQRGGSGLRPLSPLVGALHPFGHAPVRRQTLPTQSTSQARVSVPLVDTSGSLRPPPVSTSSPTPPHHMAGTGSHPARHHTSVNPYDSSLAICYN